MRHEPPSPAGMRNQGWRMVCVIPAGRLKPADILVRLTCLSESHAFLPFTYKGTWLKDGQSALWIKLGWSDESLRLLLLMFMSGNPVLDRFVRETVAEHMPGLVLTKDPRSKAHTAALYALLDSIDPQGDFHAMKS